MSRNEWKRTERGALKGEKKLPVFRPRYEDEYDDDALIEDAYEDEGGYGDETGGVPTDYDDDDDDDEYSDEDDASANDVRLAIRDSDGSSDGSYEDEDEDDEEYSDED